jgi:CheY-like chemotaxis protein
VLLAEDNAVNQLVATRILEKLGHQVTVVGNGREAVSAVQSGNYDLIAMDVQMPMMDGLDATRAIREWEITTGAHIPIVAMTAHAMKGDRERCLAAGMDAYVSKPIRLRELEHAIAGLTSVPKQREALPSKVPPDGDKIDREALLAGVEGDRRLLREAVRLFLADYPKRLREARDAIRRGNAASLYRAAHTLKGAIGNFAAKDAFAAAQQLEAIGRDARLGGAKDVYRTLESELALLKDELTELTNTHARRRTKQTREHRNGRTAKQ